MILWLRDVSAGAARLCLGGDQGKAPLHRTRCRDEAMAN
jgi:hypothetical protein